MKAIILAAGVGSRIRPLTNNKPKSLLNINGKPILQRMIENIEAVGISEVLVITGYLEEQIKTFVKINFPTLSVEYIRNNTFDTTNTGYSLMLAKEFVENDDFVKFDADVVFEKEILQKLIESNYSSALCIDRNINLAAEEVKVITDNKRRVLKVGKKLDAALATGESIGIEKIGKDAGRVLFEELEQLMNDSKNFNEYYDDSYTTLVEKGIPFGAVDITGRKWVEIDTHQDYENALQLFTDNVI